MSQKRTIEKNVQASHEASKSSRYMQSGLSDKKAKLRRCQSQSVKPIRYINGSSPCKSGGEVCNNSWNRT